MGKISMLVNGPLTRYVKSRIAQAPGMPGTFSPPPRVSDPDMRHGTCVTHVPWCMPGTLTSGFLSSRRRGKRSRHSRCMLNLQFYVLGKRPMVRHQQPHSSTTQTCELTSSPHIHSDVHNTVTINVLHWVSDHRILDISCNSMFALT